MLQIKPILAALKRHKAGTLLIAKEVLVRAAPKADVKAVIGSKFVPSRTAGAA